MSIVRRLARPLLAANFVLEGMDHVRHPGTRVDTARPLVNTLAAPLHLPNDPEMLVRANGAAMSAAGALLAMGRLPRLSSAVLAASLIPVTYVEHPFWTERDAQAKAAQRTAFLKNLGLLGGLLLAAADTGGRESLPHAAGRLSSRAAKKAGKAAKKAEKAISA